MNIKVDNCFPFHFMALGVGLCVIGVSLIFERTLLGGGLFVAGVVLLTTHHRLEVSAGNGFYREYVWLLGLKIGQKINFREIQYWYITKSKNSREYGPIYKRFTATAENFNGYLKFSDREKIFVGEESSKEKLMRKMTASNGVLKLEIIDYTLQNA